MGKVYKVNKIRGRITNVLADTYYKTDFEIKGRIEKWVVHKQYTH